MNVFFDVSFELKISDFGFMKLLLLLDMYVVMWKISVYVVLEFVVGFSVKCDVYSYGMVLLEFVMGWCFEVNFDGGGNVFVEFVICILESGNGLDCFDFKFMLFFESEVV